MDNHKDFIHIDELFKNMRSGEEPEPSGAWMRMKDLLDSELPAGTTVRTRPSAIRRYFVPALAILLLGAGGAAYYTLNKDSGAPLPVAATTSGTASAGQRAPLAAATESRQEPDKEDNLAQVRENKAASAAASRQANRGTHSSAGRKQDVAIATRPATDATATAEDRSPARMPAAPAAARRQHSAATAGHHKPDQHISKTGKNLTAGSTEPLAAAKGFEEQHVIETLVPKNGTAKPATAAPLATGSNNSGSNLKLVASRLSNKVIVEAPDGHLYEEKRDTFKRIDLVETMASASGERHSNQRRIDTVAVTRVEKISYVPLQPIEVLAVRKLQVSADMRGKVVPVASLNARTRSSEMVNLVPLSNYKVGSRRMDPGKLNQALQRTSSGIANYFDGTHNFYLSILAGGNLSFGNPTGFGMQFGIAGLYSLSERLTLAAELRYVNHYFSNYNVQDQSVSYDNVTSQLNGTEWLFSGLQTTSSATYRINSFGVLEMPLTLSYNLGRVSVFGGLDMAYAFPMQWNRATTTTIVDVQQSRSQNQNPFISSGFKVDEQQDFASRFGLGYVWGLNYDLSRKMSLDGRVSQLLWDNSKGNTDAINRLFRIPTLQFSLNYYFGRKEKVIYIMERK